MEAMALLKSPVKGGGRCEGTGLGGVRVICLRE